MYRWQKYESLGQELVFLRKGLKQTWKSFFNIINIYLKKEKTAQNILHERRKADQLKGFEDLKAEQVARHFNPGRFF
jgi:hypothetical protein